MPPAWEPEPEDDIEVEIEDIETDVVEAAEGDDDADDSGAESAQDGEIEGEDGQRKRRRRRRRRGRGDRNGAASDAAQSSDDGVAGDAVVATEVDPSDFVSSDASPSGREGFWASEKTGTPVPFRTSRDEIEAEVEAQAEIVLESTPLERIPANDATPAPAVHHTEAEQPVSAPVAVAAEPQPAVVVAPAPPRERTEVVITEADPDKPKRGGWWSRAKASLSGQ